MDEEKKPPVSGKAGGSKTACKNSIPQKIRPQFQNIPKELLDLEQWICWEVWEREGKPTKVPVVPGEHKLASVSDPSTWRSGAVAYLWAQEKELGMGFVFTSNDPYTFFDLDNVIQEDGSLLPWAREIVEKLNSYTEISPSGKGLHVIVKAKLPETARKRGVNGKLEVYNSGRYATFTGRIFENRREIRERQKEVEEIVKTYLSGEKGNLIFLRRAEPWEEEILEKARKSESGEKFVRLFDKGDITGYPSPSEADLALCSFLAFYTEGDPKKMDSLFRRSALYRKKWDEKHAADGSTYGEMTIRKALETLPQSSSWREILQEVEEAFTEKNLAKIFSKEVEEKILWVREWGWMRYDGRRWIQASEEEVLFLAGEKLQEHFLQKAALTKDTRARETYTEQALKCHQKRILNNVVQLAKGILHTRGEDFDKDGFLLNCLNGVIDLRTGKLYPHSPSQRITKLAPVEYDPKARSELWDRFLEEIFLGDSELIEFVRKALGYSITGDTSERVFFILWGEGHNGKSTLLRIVQETIGDYGKTISHDAILRSSSRTDSHPTALADLHGARMAVLFESEEGQILSTGRIKALTGRDRIKARFLHKDYFEFENQAKIWLTTNNRPRIHDQSPAIWGRIRLIPFRASFNPDSPRCDKKMLEKLRNERKAVLACLVQGCLAWQKEGLTTPESIKKITGEYKQEEDQLQRWIDSFCETTPGAKTPSRDLYNAYIMWAKSQNREPLSLKKFCQLLSEKGFHSIKGKTKRTRAGIKLKNTG